MIYFLLIPIAISIILLFLKVRKLEKQRHTPVSEIDEQLTKNKLNNQTLWGRLYGK